MNEFNSERYEQRRHDCWNGALHTYGSGYLYNLRAKILFRLLKFNNFVGIVVPIIIGGTVLTFGLDFIYLKEFIIVAGVLLLLQLILAVYIAIYNLEDKYSHYLSSSTDNYQLADEFEKVGKYPPVILDELNTQIEILEIKRSNRGNLDNRFSLTQKECREGMRFALRKYQRKCAECDIIPTNMKSTKCGVCGNF